MEALHRLPIRLEHHSWDQLQIQLQHDPHLAAEAAGHAGLERRIRRSCRRMGRGLGRGRGGGVGAEERRSRQSDCPCWRRATMGSYVTSVQVCAVSTHASRTTRLEDAVRERCRGFRIDRFGCVAVCRGAQSGAAIAVADQESLVSLAGDVGRVRSIFSLSRNRNNHQNCTLASQQLFKRVAVL